MSIHDRAPEAQFQIRLDFEIYRWVEVRGACVKGRLRRPRAGGAKQDVLAGRAVPSIAEGRLAHDLHPEGLAREGPGIQLAAAPDGPIDMVMRLYWPKTGPPSILPPGQGTWQPPALVQVAN